MKSVLKKINQNLTPNCDVIISKFGQNGSKFRFTKLYMVETQTYVMQTNLGEENPKMKSVFKLIQNLTPNCDVIIP